MTPDNDAIFSLSNDGRSESRSDAVLNRLADLISEGRLVPGNSLPPEGTLATQFNVSKSTVREALRKLEMMGVVEIVHGRGSSVRKISAEPLQFFLRLAVGSLDRGISEIIDFRRAIEVTAAGLAAENGTDEQRKELDEMMARMAFAAEEHDAWVAWDIGFHVHLAAMTGNTLIAFMVEAIGPIMEQSISKLHQQKQLRDAEMTLLRHSNIATAIQDRDSDAAQKAMQEHFDASVPVAHSLVEKASTGELR